MGTRIETNVERELREKALAKAKERGYELTMRSGDKSWYSFYNERYQLNLEVYIKTQEFVLNHMKGIVKITTDKCGSYLNDDHFKRIEKAIREVVFDTL